MHRSKTTNPLAPLLAVGLAIIALAIAWLAPVSFSVAEQPNDAAQPDAVGQTIATINKEDNGLTINRDGLYVDLDAKVVLRRAEFLEMFACTPDTREHESIVVLETSPSMIHLSLLLLGQEPGKPLSYDLNFDPPKLVPATGPEVRIFIVTKVLGKEREIPVNRWVVDTTSGEMMADNVWLFTGSRTVQMNDEPAYLADLNGSAISLVNFGDDLLTLPNSMTQDNASHGKTWAPRTEAIPKVGSEVTLRLRVQAPEPPKEGENAQAPAEPENAR